MPLFALTVLLVFVHITYTGGRVALSLYALQLQASAFTVGVLLSLLAVIPMFMSVPIGRWTDRAGPTLPTLLAILLTAAGLLSVWALQSVAGLYLNSLLLGSGFMLAHIAINNAVGQISTPDNRKSNFSFLSLGFSTSSVLGPVITGFAIDHVGHARTFLILAGFALAALGAWLLVRKHSRSAPAGPAPPANAHVMDLLRDAPLRAIFIISGLLSMGWDRFNFMVPLQGARIGLSASTIGLIGPGRARGTRPGRARCGAPGGHRGGGAAAGVKEAPRDWPGRRREAADLGVRPVLEPPANRVAALPTRPPPCRRASARTFPAPERRSR